MYYTPAVVIPGKVAHVKLEWAISSAKKENTVVYDEDLNIIYDYRKQQEQR